MITRAVVVSLEDPYHVKVRVPLLDRSETSNVYNSKDNLQVATICTLTQYDPNIQVGDVVFIMFEDRDLSHPVIVGYLYRSNKTQTYADEILGNLQIVTTAKLPFDTTIGSISYDNLKCLQGCTLPIRSELDNLQNQINELRSKLEAEVQ